MSAVWGVTMVKNEDDCVYHTLDHLVAEGVAGIVIADNMSTDNTRTEIEMFASGSPVPIVILEDKDPGYRQGEKMTKLAGIAAEMGATWVIPFDVDELWFGLDRPLAEMLLGQDLSISVVAVETWSHVETGHDRDDPNPFKRMIWRRPHKSSLPKVCYRYHPKLRIWQGNDAIADEYGRFLPAYTDPRCQIRHFGARSFEHFLGKMQRGAAAMKAAPELPESMCSHWRAYGRILERDGIEALRVIYFAHMFFAEPQLHGFVKDPAPWRRGK